ncbi:MAG: septation protein IspZ [Parvibaculum sp.]|nr:septation protein IspZ [Parvibaculum sp.]
MKEFLNDMLSTIFFVVLYLIIGDIYIATGAAIAVGVGQIGYQKARARKIDLMQWMSLFLVIVFGGATLYLHDPRFVMVKPSIIHFAIGFVMLRRGWIGRYLPPVAKENLTQRMIDVWGYIWVVVMFGLGIANIYIAMTMSPQIWGYFIAFGATGAKLALFAVQYLSMRMTVVKNIRAGAAIAAD